MSIQRIFAHLSCSDLRQSTPWFETVFGHRPDAAPMQHLAEWYHGDEAGFQLFQNPAYADAGTLTLIVKGLHSERSRLASLDPGEIERGNHVDLMRLRDPDGNLVVLAEARNE